MNNKEELVRKQMEEKMTVKYEIDGREIKLSPKIVKEYLVNGNAEITNAEFKLFTELCVARKLNPFLKEAYIIKYSNSSPASIVVGKDAILKRAVLHPKYNGMKSGIYVTNEEGEIIKRNGTFHLPNETLVGGWAEVFRKDWDNSIESSVSLEEAIQKKNDGTPNSNWQKQPATMIEKVAKVRALRETFVEDLGGMYDADEMDIDLPEVPVEEKIIQLDEEIPEANVEPVETPLESDLEQIDINNL